MDFDPNAPEAAKTAKTADAKAATPSKG